MPKYYFTFGFGQKHENGYHVIEAKDASDARGEMFRKFGTQWSMQYSSAEAAGVEKYKLREIK
jgi:hypothetical protein